jgi:crotonobetainyl-CoA:carnitine CoA-transferase CaiB-like acyl-CoA transferase
MSITGDPHGDPTKAGVALVDVLTAKDATIGILAALHKRERTGHGDHVQVNLLSSLLGSLVNQASGYLATGAPPGRMGNRHPSIAPYETLRCADRPIAVACGNDRQFGRLCAELGIAPVAADPRFADNPSRVAHRDELAAALEQALAADTAANWEARLTAAGVPAGLVGDVGDAIRRAGSYGLEPLVPLPGGGAQIRHPITWTRASVAQPADPPALGAHNGALRAWLSDTSGSPLPNVPREPGAGPAPDNG